MKKTNILLKMVFGTMLSIMLILAIGKFDSKAANSQDVVNNSESALWCWVGTCGHYARYITYYVNSSGKYYYVTSKGTDYQYLGKYIDSGNSASISKTVSYSISFTSGTEAGIDICKVSTSVTSGITTSWNYMDTLNNKTSSRKYVHAGVEYETRKSYGVKIKKRTYYPFEHLTAINKSCEYSTNTYYPVVKVPTGEGYSLLSTQKSSKLISYK